MIVNQFRQIFCGSPVTSSTEKPYAYLCLGSERFLLYWGPFGVYFHHQLRSIFKGKEIWEWLKKKKDDWAKVRRCSTSLATPSGDETDARAVNTNQGAHLCFVDLSAGTLWTCCGKAGGALGTMSIRCKWWSLSVFSTRAYAIMLWKEAAISTRARTRFPVQKRIIVCIYLVEGHAISHTAYWLVLTTLEGNILTIIIFIL